LSAARSGAYLTIGSYSPQRMRGRAEQAADQAAGLTIGGFPSMRQIEVLDL
jgi:hypothetical protein